MTSPVVPFGTAATGAAAQNPSIMSALGGLDGDGFLKLLIAQLRYQNPLQPSDPTQLMMQTSQLAQLDAIQQLASLQRRDLGLQEAVAAANLLGTHVEAIDASGQSVSGTVQAVRYTDIGPVLRLGDQLEVPLGAVTELHQ